jgi:hypothetical protein
MGNWAQRWVRDDLSVDENLDPDLLMWDVRRSVTAEGMPRDRRFVVRFQYDGVPVNRRRYWLVFDQGEADLCVKDPGFDIDLYVGSATRQLPRPCAMSAWRWTARPRTSERSDLGSR